MTKEELNEARTNPNFLKYLDETLQYSIKEKDIQGLYQVLDSYLILDLDKSKIDQIYKNILLVSQEKIQNKLDKSEILNLNEKNELFYIRAFYEYGIEKYSYSNLIKAQEIFFILIHLTNDNTFIQSLKIHLIVCELEISLEEFTKKYVKNKIETQDPIYSYFIIEYTINKEEFINKHKNLLNKIDNKLNHLIQ